MAVRALLFVAALLLPSVALAATQLEDGALCGSGDGSATSGLAAEGTPHVAGVGNKDTKAGQGKKEA